MHPPEIVLQKFDPSDVTHKRRIKEYITRGDVQLHSARGFRFLKRWVRADSCSVSVFVCWRWEKARGCKGGGGIGEAYGALFSPHPPTTGVGPRITIQRLGGARVKG